LSERLFLLPFNVRIFRLHQWAPPIFNDLPLCQRERKEGLDLEGRQFPRQLFQTQKSRLPVVHRTLLEPGAIASPKNTNSK